jgi:flotillin
MGLEIVSFTIKEVRDKNEYIMNMGRPDIARIKREADIATAEADRDTSIKRAVAMREAAVAKAQADQERVMAETASAAKQAEAQRDLELKRADFTASVRKQQATADKAYDIQANVMQQQVVAEQVKIERVQREEQIKVQEAEIQRRERELIATVLKPAEVVASLRHRARRKANGCKAWAQLTQAEMLVLPKRRLSGPKARRKPMLCT